jgi:hypothetical protein
MGIGTLSIFVGFLVKLLPKRLFAWKINEEEKVDHK